MYEAVTTREDVDERTELSDVDHAARVGGAKFRCRRVDDVEDASLRVFHLRRIGRTDGHDANRTVVVDGNVCTSLLLDGVDDLALRADDFAHLVERDSERHDLRRALGNRRARCGNCCRHHVEDLESCFLRLLQGGGEHVTRDAVDLGVKLQGSDRVRRSGDLEVHVAERIFSTEDVGERGVLAVFEDEAHCDARHWCHDRHASVHQREARGAHRCHRRRTVRRHHFRHKSQRVRKLLLVRHHGEHRALSERTVTDLAALRRTNTTRLAVCPRRHVVVVHVALLGGRRDRVDHLVHARHGQGHDVHHLCLTTLEQTSAVRGVEQADFG